MLMAAPLKTVFTLCFLILIQSSLLAETFIRWNQAGYAPFQRKEIVVLSDEDLTGNAWKLHYKDEEVEGSLGESTCGRNPHTPFPFNYTVDLSFCNRPGKYQFQLADASAIIEVSQAPYAPLLNEPLLHLQAMRSGSEHTRLRPLSHPGDAATPMWMPLGDPADGAWQTDPDGRRVNALGGWYDAGDQIKFTLTIAYTVHRLLMAYELAPEQFTNTRSYTELPDILDEAAHGLDFLMRVHPDKDTFIIQVGDENDHNQPERLPHNDSLDGQRPAFCALSRVHMASASAALARGAIVWKTLGHTQEAQAFGKMAEAIFTRALMDDTVLTAFERAEANDFYLDNSDQDQMSLAAFELYRFTQEEEYLDIARELAPPPATEVGWASWNWAPNALLAPHSLSAAQNLRQEIDGYTRVAETQGMPWGIPSRYVWASLHRWVGAAHAAGYAQASGQPSPQYQALFDDMLDYTFGRNNWGLCFLFTKQLPNSVQQIYSPMYHLLDEYPSGALSEGPGPRSTHDSFLEWIDMPENPPEERFNTKEAVFFDNRTHFMCQESTIGGQADIMLLLALASKR